MFINYSVLSKSALFSRIPIIELPNAVKCLQGYTKKISANELVYKTDEQNMPGIVLAGNLCLSQLFPDGTSVLIRTINTGELFGLFLTCDRNTDAYITAVEDSTILFLKLPVYQDVPACNCQYRSVILENLIRILIKNNIYLNQHIKIISRPTIREKLLEFFNMLINNQNSDTIHLTMTREKLAEYICADRSALSRELGRMQKDRLIEDRKSVV